MENQYACYHLVYIGVLCLVVLLFFVAYWFSKFPEAVTETFNQVPDKEPYDDVP